MINKRELILKLRELGEQINNVVKDGSIPTDGKPCFDAANLLEKQMVRLKEHRLNKEYKNE